MPVTTTRRLRLAAFVLPLGSAVPFAFAVPLGCAPFASVEAADDSRAATTSADLWDWCPAPVATAAVDEDALWLQFTDSALYCSMAMPTWDESVTAFEQLEGKAQLRLVPGDNFLPMEPGEHDVTLPLCSRRASTGAPVAIDPGRLVVEKSEQLGQTRLDLSYLQTAHDENGAALTSYVRISGYEEDLASGVLLDGVSWPLPDPDVKLFLCEGPDCAAGERMVAFDACALEGPREVHRLVFDGGEVTFVLGTKANASPLRAHLLSATGEIGGATFEERSFWRLVGRETWPWSSARDFAVAFTEPAGNVCALTGARLYPESTGSFVELRRCDGTVDARAVTSHTVAIEDDEDGNAGETP